MENIKIIKGDEGYTCIRVMRKASLLELGELCKMIESGLKERGFFDSTVDCIINKSSVTIDIEMFDEDYGVIGTVECACDEDVSTDFYDLTLFKTSVQSEEWEEENWNEYSYVVFCNIIEILSK